MDNHGGQNNYRGGNTGGRGRGGGRGGFGGRGGGRGGHHGGNQRDNTNPVPAQQQKETPDHSPIGDLEGLIARLGDTYLTLDDPSQVNLYNNYNHQFDIVLPEHPILETFYNEPVEVHMQIRKIGDEIKSLLSTSINPKTNKTDAELIERIVRTVFRAIVAFPTKISIYAAFVAYIGLDHPNFLTLILNEAYKQLEASIKGLFMVMLLDVKKKNLDIHGTGKSKALLQLLTTLTLSTTPTTTISTPAIHYEALMRFISSLVGYACLPYSTWTAIITSILTICQIPTTIPNDGNYDSIKSVQYGSGGVVAPPTGNESKDKSTKVGFFLPDALPFELSSVQSVIEKLSQNSTTVTTTIIDESSLTTPTPPTTTTTSTNNDDSDHEQDPSVQQHHQSSQHRTNQVLTGKTQIHFTALNDILVHGVLSALTFASRDVLNFGTEHNKVHSKAEKMTQIISHSPQNSPITTNSDSILFNLTTNWYNNLESRSPVDTDVELEYDFKPLIGLLVLPGIDLGVVHDVIIDQVPMKLTPAEYFYTNTLKSISSYIFYRNEAFSEQIREQENTEPLNQSIPNIKSATVFNSSPFLTDSANSFKFFSQPELFQDDQISAYITQDSVTAPQYFDYLTWSYFCITGSLPDGGIHIIRPLQDPLSGHAWGLITRPFSIPTPASRGFKENVKSRYIKIATDLANGIQPPQSTKVKPLEGYTFNSPGQIDTRYVYMIPSVDNTTTSTASIPSSGSTRVPKKKAGMSVNATTTTTTTSVPEAEKKMSKKILDYISPQQQDLLQTYQSSFTPSVQSQPIFYITQPAAFPPVLPLLPHRAPPAQQSTGQITDKITNQHNPSQGKYTIVPNANNIDVWLTYSYLFYSNLTYYGLQEEYNSLLSSLPPLFPIWGYSQSPLYLDNETSAYRKYVRCCSTTSLQSAATQSTISTVISFFFALIISNQNNFVEPLTPIDTNLTESSPFLHNNLTSNHKSYLISTLIRFMYEHPTKVPPALGPRFFQLFKLCHYISIPSRQHLATWFAEHLCQFNFMFPWTHLEFLNSLNDPTHPQHNFVSAVLSRCVQLTSFSVVAANVRQLWLLLPSIGFAMNNLKPQHVSGPMIGSSSENVRLLDQNGGGIVAESDIEQKLILAPTITTSPSLNEPFLILSKALQTHVHKSIVMTTMYFAPGVFNTQLIQQFQQLLVAFQPLEVASSYISDPPTRPQDLTYLSTQQAATWGVDVKNINIFACYLWVAILIASKPTNTHFQYFMANYGDLLTILANTTNKDLLHTGFHSQTMISDQGLGEDDGDQVTSTVPGYNPYSKEYETIDPSQYPQLINQVITNSNLATTQSVQFPPQMLYHNGFIVCPLLDPMGELVTPSRTVITSLPNPTQLIMLDFLFLFYNNELSKLPIKIQFLIQFNVISIPTILVWLLFYLPRHQHLKATVFNPLLIEVLYLVIDHYLMVNNEKESKFLDLFKSTFATIATNHVPILSSATTAMADAAQGSNNINGTDTQQQDDITPALLDRLTKIKQQQDKITNYKVNFFSTIFSLIYDWVSDWLTLVTVLKTQAFGRNEAFLQNVDSNNDIDDGDEAEQRLKRQRTTESSSEMEPKLDNITLVYQGDDSITKHVASVIVAILLKYKVELRNISKDLIDQCNIPGLEPIIKQVFQ